MNKCKIKASGKPQGDYSQKEERKVNTIKIEDCFNFKITVDSIDFFIL